MPQAQMSCNMQHAQAAQTTNTTSSASSASGYSHQRNLHEQLRQQLMIQIQKSFKSSKCQCIAQTSLVHWAQPNILYLQLTHFTCTAHIPSLYKALYCTLLFTHQYTDYSVFLSHFILLTILKILRDQMLYILGPVLYNSRDQVQFFLFFVFQDQI